MNTNNLINKLDFNLATILNLLSPKDEIDPKWRPYPEHWCFLEIICHLIDEEKDDFRKRVFLLLEKPGNPLPPFNPSNWVSERKYMEQNFEEKLKEFRHERKKSIQMLHSLVNPKWENSWNHPKLGLVTSSSYLHNWLAHDYLHIRQITKVKYLYLKEQSKNIDFEYAGTWVK